MDQHSSKPLKNSAILRWILIVGITIVLNMFFYFAINTLYPQPQYNDFCPAQAVNIQPTTQAECVAGGGQWNENTSMTKTGSPLTPADIQSNSYCDVQFTCNKNYTTASDLYGRNVFIALVVLGILSLFAGFYFSAITPVSLGLSFGGVLSLVIGSMRYWSAMADYLRVIILGIALVALIWIGVKKFQD